jgi:hypothetical protein
LVIAWIGPYSRKVIHQEPWRELDRWVFDVCPYERWAGIVG